jgi:hypothetical protein
MTKLIKKWIKNLFTVAKPGDELEKYILNKKPTSIADIEKLTNQYYYMHRGGSL